MTWVSHSEAVRRFKIGKETIRSRVKDGSLDERKGHAANGQTERLVRTEQLDALGYERREPRPAEDRPFIEERIEGLEEAIEMSASHDRSMLIRADAQDAMLQAIYELLANRERTNTAAPGARGRGWLVRVCEWYLRGAA